VQLPNKINEDKDLIHQQLKFIGRKMEC